MCIRDSSFDKASYARQGIFKDAEFNIQYSASAIQLNENGMSGLQSKAPLNDEMVRNISSIDGVKKVSEIKNFGVRFDIPVHDEYGNDDTVYPLSEKETEEIGKYIEEGTADYDKLMSGDYILVHSNATVKEIFGWSFQVGDQITLHYYDGTQMAEKEVTVLGVLNHQYTCLLYTSSCTCKRKKPGPCSYSLRNTTVFQLCLAYHLLQHGSLSAGIYMAGSDVDPHHRHNHSVQKSIESGRFASDSLYTVGRLCGISQFWHISFELIPRQKAKPLLRKSNRLFHNFS